jgi:hypothetical protein
MLYMDFRILSNLIICYIILCYMVGVMLIGPEKTKIIVVLGCDNSQIQDQRVQSVIHYIDSSPDKVVLYLSGGSKNGNTNSEASIMRTKIEKTHPDIKIYTDNISSNTAENFINLNKWIQENNSSENNQVVITTSDFHKDRAEKIFNGVVGNIKPEWNLSISNCKWCWEAEPIHMKNVDADIMRALELHQI